MMRDTLAQRQVRVSNPHGLHARPAELFATTAQRFQAQIEVIKEDRRVDAKSILNILTLGATVGTELTLEARGEDAIQALDALVKLVNSDFAVDENNHQE